MKKTNTNIETLIPTDPRLFLRNELLRRCKLNPSYSLRSFARQLDIESSALSKILSGKRNLTPTMMKKIGFKLQLDPLMIQQLSAHTLENRGKKNSSDIEQSSVNNNYQQITIDTFKAISDWYHFAILEMTRLNDFLPEARHVARSLGITVNEVNDALERLVRLEMLEISDNGSWTDISGSITTTQNEFTSIAHKKLQKQLLQLALNAIDNIDISERDNSSIAMATDSALLPEAKQMITKFRRKLCHFLESGTKKDAVYNLSIGLFPLTKKIKK